MRSGYIAIVGRPNVGKSSLLNRLVGQKVSIISQRPQTTRHRILGIKTTDEAQFVYVDTPGLHEGGRRAMNQYLNRAAKASLAGVDCILLVITAQGWTDEDEAVLRLVKEASCPVFLVINKIDRLPDRAKLLPLIAASAQEMPFAEIIPVSARSGDNLADIERSVLRHLPEQPALFPEDQVTDRSERFLAAELVREQVFRGFGQELPYATTVEIEQYKETKPLVRIEAVIWVEKEGQKAILIGKDGARLKTVGERARKEIERLVGKKVYLGLWIKVREGWSDDLRALQSLGYREPE